MMSLPGFLSVPAAKIHAPRQGPQTRVCVVTRDRLPRTLLWRVVRSPKNDPLVSPTDKKSEGKKKKKKANNDYNVTVISDIIKKEDRPLLQGRSAYVRKELHHVQSASKKNRLGKALRCRLPQEVESELKRLSLEWEQTPVHARGLLYAECFGLEGVDAAVFDVQDGNALCHHDTYAAD